MWLPACADLLRQSVQSVADPTCAHTGGVLWNSLSQGIESAASLEKH